jgi:hypothetical protein
VIFVGGSVIPNSRRSRLLFKPWIASPGLFDRKATATPEEEAPSAVIEAGG